MTSKNREDIFYRRSNKHHKCLPFCLSEKAVVYLSLDLWNKCQPILLSALSWRPKKELIFTSTRDWSLFFQIPSAFAKSTTR